MSNRSERDGVTLTGTILRTLRDHGTLSRVELTQHTGLSAATITRKIAVLLADGTVEEREVVNGGALGRPAIGVALTRSSNRVIGVQIGVGTVTIAVVDVLGGTEHVRTIPYDAASTADDVISLVVETVRPLADPSVVGVGVAVPGPVDAAGRRMLMPINLAWRDVPIADDLEAALGIPVVAEHNVRSMALAEARFGEGRARRSVGFIYAGAGIGAGVVVDGAPLSVGVHGAIELGHLRVEAEGAPCVCGGRGCLETIASADALRRRLDGLGIAHREDAHPLVTLCRAEDASARREASVVLSHLATGVSTVTNLLNPELLMLGGGLADLPDAARDELIARARNATFPLIRDSIDIRPSSLGPTAGVIGAACAALDRLLYA
ncbi:ROK family transcriptional regulator [Microbacterium sp. SSW1-59]|uniref:ROK family transcriptional regulator n=1 Tax=Microbacterium xanthum TaxID=3079794 RepID=UPI002AD522BF|nr:ROK family transcriptional regulator [Microbacterium sp. SSW1-59]MDZ8200350.1 ROK family transcriptional regulator [Microbacterium sp. SSW1-59]